MRISLTVLSTAVFGDHIFALLEEENNTLSLISFNRELEVEDKMATLKSSRGFILDIWKESIHYLVSIDMHWLIRTPTYKLNITFELAEVLKIMPSYTEKYSL